MMTCGRDSGVVSGYDEKSERYLELYIDCRSLGSVSDEDYNEVGGCGDTPCSVCYDLRVRVEQRQSCLLGFRIGYCACPRCNMVGGFMLGVA